MAGLKREAAEDPGAAGGVPGEHWQRRAARREAERRRMPKHGKAYVALAQQLIGKRAAEAITGTAAAAPKHRVRRRASSRRVDR